MKSVRNHIDILNLFIPKKYIIIEYNPKTHSELLSDFTIKEQCVPIQDFDKNGLLIFERESGELMSYVLYGFSETSDDNEEFLTLDIFCTGLNYRKRNLSTFLNLVLFLYAIDNNIRYLACDTNDASFKLLEKFGFSGREYSEKFNWLYSTSVDTRDPVFIENVRNFFKPKKPTSPRRRYSNSPVQRKQTLRKPTSPRRRYSNSPKQ